MTLDDIDAMSDEDVGALFRCARWPPNGEPACPRCGASAAYWLVDYGRWRCSARACRADFTLLGRTLFASSKVPARTILKVAAIFCREPRPPSMEIARTIGTDYRTAWIITGKLQVLTDGEPANVEDLLARAMRADPSPRWSAKAHWARVGARNWEW